MQPDWILFCIFNHNQNIETMYKVFHNIDAEKTSIFNSDLEFITFVKNISVENEDGNLLISNIDEAKDYINNYCPNLNLI